jgi:hypothetical protein
MGNFINYVRWRWCAVSIILATLSITTAYAQPSYDRDPIAFIGHGALFGPDGSEIAPTVKFIDSATNWYISNLKRKLSPADASKFKNLSKDFLLNLPPGQSRLLVKTHLIEWMIDHVRDPDSDRIRGKIRLLKGILANKLTDHSNPAFPRGIEPYVVEPQIATKLRGLRKSAASMHPFSLTENGGAAYRSECADAGVPIPPDFGPGKGWVSQGTIAKDDLFILRSLDAEVLTWKSSAPEGMCIALPRFDPVEKIVKADGVICVGKVTSKVCFWDNQVIDMPKDKATFEFPLGSEKSFSEWAGGADLRAGVGGICTDCHAGENPYIVQGKILSALSDTHPTFPNEWYVPIVRSGDEKQWPENPGPGNAPPACQGCHSSGDAGRLPKLSSDLLGYCGAVLRPSLGALAPRLLGSLNPPPSMPQGRNVGKLACTPGLQPNDPRYRACSAATTFDCTPDFSEEDERRLDPEFPQAYRVSCTAEISELLKRCTSQTR